MRLRPPPRVSQDPRLDAFLQDVYQSMILNVGHTSPCWADQNVSASQTSAAMNLLGTSDNTEVVMSAPGNIVGISISSNDARTAGTLTVKPTINGTESTTLSAALNATDTQYAYAIQEFTKDNFLAGQRLGVKITTDGSWAPTTADIVVNMTILH